jgi:membrane-associated phospholipid phosphatase
MPPLFAHDPLDAVQRAGPGWLLAPATALSVACEYWVVALLALAVYAWLELDVPATLKACAPLLLALAVGVGVVAAGARVGVAAGWGVRAVPSGHALWGATFAAYTLWVYGRRVGWPVALVAFAGGVSRIYLGSNGVPSVLAGWVIGGLIGSAAFGLSARLVPGWTPGLRRDEGRDAGAPGGPGTP